jgi:sugar lactone lactonase YvrE
VKPIPCAIVLWICIAATGCLDDNRSISIPTVAGPGVTWTTSPPLSNGNGNTTPPTTTETGTTSQAVLCDAPPPPVPTSFTTIPGIPTSEEFTLHSDGTLLNINDSDELIYTSTILGETVVLAPYSSSEVGAPRLLLDGDIVVADEANSALMRVSLEGAITPLLGSITEPNSLVIHPDGWIYVTSNSEIWRVDPDNVQPAELMFTVAGADLDGLTFSPDFDWLYLNDDDSGEVYMAEVLNDRRLGPPIEFQNISLNWGAELDGMAVDVCNFIYIVVTDGRVMRVTVDGLQQELIDLGGGYTTALHFGNGAGGWQTTHLYVMDRSGDLVDIDVGIAGKWEPHHPIATTSTSGP